MLDREDHRLRRQALAAEDTVIEPRQQPQQPERDSDPDLAERKDGVGPEQQRGQAEDREQSRQKIKQQVEKERAQMGHRLGPLPKV
jgi:hypothetical protein